MREEDNIYQQIEQLTKQTMESPQTHSSHFAHAYTFEGMPLVLTVLAAAASSGLILATRSAPRHSSCPSLSSCRSASLASSLVRLGACFLARCQYQYSTLSPCYFYFLPNVFSSLLTNLAQVSYSHWTRKACSSTT